MTEFEKHSPFNNRSLDTLNNPASALAVSQAEFALNLLRNTNQPESTIVSPISISLVLAMLHSGAKNNTANQLLEVFAKGASDDAVYAHFCAFMSFLSSNNLSVTLESANKLYVDEKLKLLDSYLTGIKQNFEGQLEQVNFELAAKTTKKINDFVEKASHNHIKDIISPNAINDLTRLVVVNALYFKGDWHKEFNACETHEAKFYATPEKTTKKEFMQIEDEFCYFETDGYQVLGLPYTNFECYLYVFLPTERYGLDDLINNLNGTTLIDLIGFRDTKKVMVKLPKFKIEAKFELTQTLQKLGVVDAFNNPDFSGMTEDAGLVVSSIVHKACIEITEKGTIAAAASAAVMQVRCAPIQNLEPPKEFFADHGFVYVLTDDINSHMFFVGKVAE